MQLTLAGESISMRPPPAPLALLALLLLGCAARVTPRRGGVKGGKAGAELIGGTGTGTGTGAGAGAGAGTARAPPTHHATHQPHCQAMRQRAGVSAQAMID